MTTFKTSSIVRKFLVFIALCLSAACANTKSANDDGWLIENAQLIDGTGSAAVTADVRLANQRIIAIGQLSPLPSERVIDATGLVLAPGFIDTHSHADSDLDEHPYATAATSQGITTTVFGQDGESTLPLKSALDHWESTPAAVNVASYSGHNSLRHQVMGDDFKRPATAGEVEAMKILLQSDLQAGALGLATGLEYDPGIYSDAAEVIELARVTGTAGGRYISHIRSEDRFFEAAIEEIITVGREAQLPVQISHLKLAMTTLWGKTPWLLARLDKARTEGIDITADVYPYEYWQSTLEVLFPERNFTDLNTAREILNTLAPADGLLMSQYLAQPELVGKTIADIASIRNTSPEQTLLDMIADAQHYTAEHQLDDGSIISSESVIGTSMRNEDIAELIVWEHSNICTDGGLIDRHPRAIGSFPRVLRWLVREEKRLSLEEAVHKMTLQAAENVGISHRGVVRVGAFADLVLFNQSTVSDRATPQQPHLQSIGIEKVWVNGTIVFQNGTSTSMLPGQVIRRASSEENETM
ncbi:MAG: amidohydrolase family protein [Pseudomonadales bacterium]